MIIYRALNTKNSKVYIGLTIKDIDVRKDRHLRDAKRGSQYSFHRAIRKYGEDSFEWSIIDTAETITELKKREIYWIDYYNSFRDGYNMTLGGDGANGRIGEKQGSMTLEQAKKVVWLLENTRKTESEIAQEIGVTRGSVNGISSGENWKHLYKVPPCLNRPSGTRGGYKQKKITEEEAKEIIILIEDTDLTYKKIAEMFNTSSKNVGSIARGSSWKHLYDKPPIIKRNMRKEVKLNGKTKEVK